MAGRSGAEALLGCCISLDVRPCQIDVELRADQCLLQGRGILMRIACGALPLSCSRSALLIQPLSSLSAILQRSSSRLCTAPALLPGRRLETAFCPPLALNQPHFHSALPGLIASRTLSEPRQCRTLGNRCALSSQLPPPVSAAVE